MLSLGKAAATRRDFEKAEWAFDQRVRNSLTHTPLRDKYPQLPGIHCYDVQYWSGRPRREPDASMQRLPATWVTEAVTPAWHRGLR